MNINLENKLIKKIECIHPKYVEFFKTVNTLAKSYRKLIIGETCLVFLMFLVIIFLICVMISIIDNPEQPIVSVFMAICSMGALLGVSCEKLLDSHDRYEFYNNQRMRPFKDFLR